MRRFVLALSLACCASAQVPIANPGFEQDTVGVPTGWFMPKPGADAGFKAEVTAENCRTGAHCALLTGVANPPPSVFGNLMQTLSAATLPQRAREPARCARSRPRATATFPRLCLVSSAKPD